MTSDLDPFRTGAATASRGISGDPIYRAILARVDALAGGGRVLDFGAGTGHLSSLLRERPGVTEVHAADLVDYGERADPRISWIFADLNDRLPVPDASYDLVVAAEVIEHLENPRFVAREWFRLLRPGGSLILSTPNNESWRSLVSLLIRGHFTAFTGGSYPAHITALLRTDLARILAECGFTGIEFGFTDHGAVPALTGATWQRLSAGLLRGMRYSDNIVCTARRP